MSSRVFGKGVYSGHCCVNIFSTAVLRVAEKRFVAVAIMGQHGATPTK